MDKLILKKIAKEWAAGILYHGAGTDSFEEGGGLTSEEEGYIVDEVQKIAKRILKGNTPGDNLNLIVQKYYEFE